MVMGPEEALQKIIEKETPKIQRLEQAIDDAIQSKFEGRGQVTVSVDRIGIRRYAIDELLKKYQQAGWQRAEYVSDQRDGCYISLSKTDNSGSYFRG